MSDAIGRKGWRTILGGASDPTTGAPEPQRQPKQPDAEDYIARIKSAQDAVANALDRLETANQDLHAAQRAFAGYIDAQKIDVTQTPKIFTLDDWIAARQHATAPERIDGQD